jgi:hypothetical protein
VGVGVGVGVAVAGMGVAVAHAVSTISETESERELRMAHDAKILRFAHVRSTLTLDTSRRVLCPIQWECSSTGQFFGSQSQCLATCTSSCFREANCSGNCICP